MVFKTERNYHRVTWDFEPEEGHTIADYRFRLYYSLSPACDFRQCLDEDGNVITIDGATSPLEITHPLKHYDFNKWYYYKVRALRKFS